jgi:ubiquinone biosynthesis protein
VDWLLALFWYVTGFWAVIWLARRLVGTQVPPARTGVSGLLGLLIGLLIGLGGAAMMRASNPGRDLYAVDFVVISMLTTLVLVALSGLVARPQARSGSGPTLRRPRPLRALRRRRSRTGRYVQIVLIRAQCRLSARAGRRERRPDEPNGTGRKAGLDLTGALQKAGGMFVKLGQVLSTRPDLVPPHVLARLATLQDRVAPAPSDEVTALLTAELGEPPEHMFTSFHRTPVAAASLAQVHRAQLASGAPVAVKALRPGVEDLVERDLDIMLRLARTAHGQTRWARRLGVRDLVQGFSDNLS